MHRLAAAHVHDGEAYARVREAVERVQQAARAQRKRVGKSVGAAQLETLDMDDVLALLMY